MQFKVYYSIESVDEDSLIISLVDQPYEFFAIKVADDCQSMTIVEMAEPWQTVGRFKYIDANTEP